MRNLLIILFVFITSLSFGSKLVINSDTIINGQWPLVDTVEVQSSILSVDSTNIYKSVIIGDLTVNDEGVLDVSDSLVISGNLIIGDDTKISCELGVVMVYGEVKENGETYDPDNDKYEACALLPIELLYFRGVNNEGINILEWATATEVNNDYFVILKSINALDFIELDEISGAGNSNNVLTYTYIDDSFVGGNYYRLKQVDYNGNSESFNVIYLDDNKPTDISEIILFDLSGKILKRQSSSKSVVLENLASGVYIITIISPYKVRSEKLIIK
jgi:hypothetical protein